MYFLLLQREPRFGFWHPLGSLQPSVTLVPGEVMLSSCFHEHQAWTLCTYIHAGAHSYMERNLKKKFLGLKIAICFIMQCEKLAFGIVNTPLMRIIQVLLICQICRIG